MARRRASRRTPEAVARDTEVLVVGLGRFGMALATTLVELGHEVLGVDTDPQLVQEAADHLTHVAEADATSAKALGQLGVDHFGAAVVGIGSDIEASILATAVLVDAGIPSIWAKAVTQAHGRILERIGAHQVVYPEFDMGERVAHLVTGRMMDYIELDDGFALVETAVPSELWGVRLADSNIRQDHGVTVVCIKPEGEPFTYATPTTVIQRDDILLIAGETLACERFANLT